MWSFTKRLLGVFLFGTLMLGFAVPPSQGQSRPPQSPRQLLRPTLPYSHRPSYPPPVPRQWGPWGTVTTSSTTPIAPPRIVVVNRPVYAPAAWGVFPDAYGEYLRGAAAVIDSQGQFMIDEEYASWLREQRRQAQTDT